MGNHKARSDSVKYAAKKLTKEARNGKKNKNFTYKEGKFMTTFAGNLKTWMTGNSLNATVLSSRSGVNENRIKGMQNGNVIPTREEVELLARAFKTTTNTFLRGCDMDFPTERKSVNQINIPTDVMDAIKNTKPTAEESVTDDENESYREVCFEFAKYPLEYRKVVVSIFFKEILRKTKLTGAAYEDLTHIARGNMSNYINRKNAITIDTLIKHSEMLEESGLVSREEFFTKFKSVMDGYIPNYNLNVAVEKYGFSLARLTKLIGAASDSSGGNWHRYNSKILSGNCALIAKELNVDPTRFMTEVFTEDDFTSPRLKNLPYDQVATKFRDKPSNFQKGKDKKNENPTKVIKEEPKTDGIEENIETPIFSIPEPIKGMPAKTINETLEVPMETKIQKMYGKLTKEHRDTVNALIEKYFWEDFEA